MSHVNHTNIQCVIHNTILVLNCPVSFILSPHIPSHPHPLTATGLNQLVPDSAALWVFPQLLLFSGSQRHEHLTDIHLCFCYNSFFLPSFSFGKIHHCSILGFPQTVRSEGNFFFAQTFISQSSHGCAPRAHVTRIYALS